MKNFLFAMLLIFSVSLSAQNDLKKPSVFEFGSSVKAMKTALTKLSDSIIVRADEPIQLPTAKKNQTQLDIYGFEFQGKKRLVELIFADDALDIVWILTNADEEKGFIEKFTSQYGTPTHKTEDATFFINNAVAVRNKPHELLFISNRLIEPYKQFLQSYKVSEVKSTRDLLKKMKVKNDGKWFQHFTFKQATVSYDAKGIKADSTVWYEAVSYPYQFRIDRDIKQHNYTIYKNDSTYTFTNQELKNATDKPATHLLFKGGLYFVSLEEALDKLKKYKYNIDSFRKDKFHNRTIYVIGNADNQFWLDAENFYCVRRIYTTQSGKTVDVIYDNFKRLGKGFVEQKVTFYVDKVKRLEEFYFDIKLRDNIDPKTFSLKQNNMWYKEY